jgi:hypothetical protein
MMFSATARIQAQPARVWAILMDTARWPELDSSIDRVEGTLSLGAKVTVHAKIGRAFPLTVVTFEPERKMVLSGGMPLGLFKGQRTYTLDADAGGVVTFTMREVFSGLLAPLITKSIPNLQPSFDQFTANVRARAEAPG